MEKVLVCFFSATGVTRFVARKISEEIEGDLFEIEPINSYSKEDLDWTNKESRTTIEMSNKDYRPKVKRKIENLDLYNKIIIGFPVWWYTAPTIINTFIEENDLSNKEIYVYVTSGGSSEIESFKDLKNKYPNLNFISARKFNGKEPNGEYKKWIN